MKTTQGPAVATRGEYKGHALLTMDDGSGRPISIGKRKARLFVKFADEIERFANEADKKEAAGKKAPVNRVNVAESAPAAGVGDLAKVLEGLKAQIQALTAKGNGQKVAA